MISDYSAGEHNRQDQTREATIKCLEKLHDLHCHISFYNTDEQPQ